MGGKIVKISLARNKESAVSLPPSLSTTMKKGWGGKVHTAAAATQEKKGGKTFQSLSREGGKEKNPLCHADEPTLPYTGGEN